jgi:hypothetical protein
MQGGKEEKRGYRDGVLVTQKTHNIPKRATNLDEFQKVVFHKLCSNIMTTPSSLMSKKATLALRAKNFV